MYYLYILQSKKDLRSYTGYTKNLKQRLEKHNNGKVIATRHRKPLKIIYLEKCINKEEAKKREKYWKSGAGRKNLQRIYRGVPASFFKTRRGSLQLNWSGESLQGRI
ncbi:MAG: GIY-YIG nuclease family protein [Minisyncoccales bacterium]